MAEPVTVPIQTDPEALVQVGRNVITAAFPNWDPARADQVDWVLRACAYIIAEARDTASDVPTSIYRYLGRWLVGLPPIDATQAQADATITVADAAGYTIPAGIRVRVMTAGDTGVVFYASEDVTIAPGDTATATGGVHLVAEVAGAAGSGLPSGSAVRTVDSLAYIDNITLETSTSGGDDAETDDAYLARFAVQLALFTPTPILPLDFVLLAKTIPGVGRALALDGYNPADGTSNNERRMTVAITGTDGYPAASGVKTTVDAFLQGLRELSFLAGVIDATYTPIDVAWAAVCYPDADPAGVQAAGDAALASYLDPSQFGRRLGDEGGIDWTDTNTVRRLELSTVLNNVVGLDYVTALTLAKLQSVTGVASTDVFTAAGHGFALNDPVVFTSVTGGAGITPGTTYYARDVTTNTFKVSATVSGSAVNVTSDMTAGFVAGLNTTDVTIPGPAALTVPGTILGVATAP